MAERKRLFIEKFYGPDETSRGCGCSGPASMFLLLILARHFCWRWMRCLRHMLRLRMICLRMRGLRHMMRLRMVRLRMRLLGDVLWSRASLLFEMRFRGAFYM